MKTWYIAFLLTLFLVSVVSAVEVYCGDGICHTGETETSCPTDCRCETQIVYVENITYTEQVVQRAVSVPFFERPTMNKLLNTTCGYDANSDGILCDPNEDFTSCNEDCATPSLDNIMCIGTECVWQEAWFARTLLLVAGGIGVFLFIRSRR